MDINISISIDEKKGLMGVSLADIVEEKPVIVKKPKKKRKKKDPLTKAIESSIPSTSEYTTEVV
jgi:hypothetical protein